MQSLFQTLLLFQLSLIHLSQSWFHRLWDHQISDIVGTFELVRAIMMSWNSLQTIARSLKDADVYKAACCLHQPHPFQRPQITMSGYACVNLLTHLLILDENVEKTSWYVLTRKPYIRHCPAKDFRESSSSGLSRPSTHSTESLMSAWSTKAAAFCTTTWSDIPSTLRCGVPRKVMPAVE